MKWVKILKPFSVAATNTHYAKGVVVEVSDQLAKRHGKEGTGFLEETKKPRENTSPEK